jgi:hypothetical protein
VALVSADGLGARFARAIADKDTEALTAVLSPDVDFKALTPRKFWEGDSAADVLEAVFGSWFGESDDIDTAQVEVTAGTPVEDTQQVGYRFAITNPDGQHTVEQQAYYRAEGDRIGYLRIVCSGYRPVTPAPADR